MTDNDLICINKFISSYKQIKSDLRVGILSPIASEYEYYSNFFKNITPIYKSDWDLNYPSEYCFDIIISSNVLHYSNNPKLWIDNILNSCNLFLMQDLLKRQRSPDNEYGHDGDSVRYSFDGYNFVKDSFNLSSLDYKIINSYIYNGGSNEYDDNPKHFICLLTHDT